MDLKLLVKVILSGIWGILTFVLYFQEHSSFVHALFAGRHIGFIVVSLGIFFGLVYAIIKKKKWALRLPSGVGIIFFVLIGLLMVQIFLVGVFEIPHPIHWEKILLLDLAHILGMGLIVTGTILNGFLMIHWLKIEPQSSVYYPSIFGLGILGITLINFFLGYFQLLQLPFTWLPLVWPVLLAPRKSWKIFKAFWWSPIKGIKEVKWSGWLAIWVIGFFVVLNFLEGIRPVPKGYDALTQYYNIIQIMGQTDQLVEGFGAYNWLLYIGLGRFVFEWDSLSFVLSNSMVFFSAVVLYFLAKSRVSKNTGLIIAAVFMATPLINVVPGLQQKVEGGILLFSIIGVHTLLVVLEDRSDLKKYLLWLGILSGYLFGIKYSALILIWAFAGVIAWYFGNFWTLVTAVGLILSGIIFLNLDAYADLNSEHLNRERSVYWLIGISVVSGIIALKDPLVQWKKIMWSFLLLIGGGALSFAPWLVKHYGETQSLQIPDLLNGSNQELFFDFEALKTQIQNEKNSD